MSQIQVAFDSNCHPSGTKWYLKSDEIGCIQGGMAVD